MSSISEIHSQLSNSKHDLQNFPSSNKRNAINYSEEYITEHGKKLLVKDSSNPVEWIDSLDRKKVTVVTYSCLEKIFSTLQLNESEITSILDLRKKENKRVSTALRRKVVRQTTQDIEALKLERSELETEKALLKVDIEIYKRYCSDSASIHPIYN